MNHVIEVDVEHRFGAFALNAAFASNGRLTVLFGRSGSGKSSLVNIIGGLVKPQRGRVAVDGHVLVETTQRLFVPKHRRRIGYVFQEARLFPHLTVRQNLLFGRWFAPRDAVSGSDLPAVRDLLGIAHLLDRHPGALSGGEKQRVAIGRALLAKPRLLLMDEPLAALDDARKAEILPYIERLRDEIGIPIVYVTHSVAEVARLANTLVMLENGSATACGPAAELLSRLDLPVLAGTQDAGAVIEGQIDGHDEEYGLTLVSTPAGPLQVARRDLAIGSRLRLRIQASDIMVSLTRPEGISALNVLPGTISGIGRRENDAAAVEIAIDCNGTPILARLTAKSVDRLGLAPGRAVHAVIKSVAIDAP